MLENYKLVHSTPKYHFQCPWESCAVRIPVGEGVKEPFEQDGPGSSVVKGKNKAAIAVGITKMDTSSGEDVRSKDEETFNWLRDCFKDLLTANS